MTAAQIQLERVWIHSGAAAGASANDERAALLATGEPALQRLRDGLRDVVLQCEDVGKLAIVSFTPQAQSVARADELHGDAHARAGATHRSLEHGCDAKPLGDGTQIHALPLEGKRRRLRGDT